MLGSYILGDLSINSGEPDRPGPEYAGAGLLESRNRESLEGSIARAFLLVRGIREGLIERKKGGEVRRRVRGRSVDVLF